AFGQPADMDPVVEVANRHRLSVVEDACEAIGAQYKERRVGMLGDSACFAFYPNKQMTTGEGGMLVTNDRRVANVCASMRNQGRAFVNGWLTHARLGYNYRLNDLACALGIVQLSRLEDMLARRARVASWYDERIGEMEGVHPPLIAATTGR